VIVRRALVVAAHPDDEALGCGGTLARLAAEGTEVHLLFVADGVGARGAAAPDPEALAARRAMGDAAARLLGAQAPTYLDFPDNRLDGQDLLDIVQQVERVARGVAPELVLTHFAGDLNVDHRCCAHAVATAFRPVSGQTVKSIWTFEVPSSTEWAFGVTGQPFRPNVFVDISAHLEVKLAALEAYSDEMRPFPHPRSAENVTALARNRGATIGVAAAEAFHLMRLVH
jgi:N-acetylglucosamine malate deacetylase 1